MQWIDAVVLTLTRASLCFRESSESVNLRNEAHLKLKRSSATGSDFLLADLYNNSR